MLKLLFFILSTTDDRPKPPPALSPSPPPSPPPYYPNGLDIYLNNDAKDGSGPAIMGARLKINGTDTMSNIFGLGPTIMPHLNLTVEIGRPTSSKTVLGWITVKNIYEQNINYALGVSNLILNLGVEDVCLDEGYSVLGNINDDIFPDGSEIMNDIYPLYSFIYGNNEVGKYKPYKVNYIISKTQYIALSPLIQPNEEHTWLFIVGYGSIEGDSNSPGVACQTAKKYTNPKNWPADFLETIPDYVDKKNIINWDLESTEVVKETPEVVDESNPMNTPLYATIIVSIVVFIILLVVVWLAYKEMTRS